MVGTMPADNISATQPSALTEHENDVLDDQYMFVQLRPGTSLLRKCLAHLATTKNEHPDVVIDIDGYTREDHQVLLTLAVNLGPKDKIAKPSPEAVAGFHFVSAIFTGMFDYLPQYTDKPTALERARAAELPGLLAEAAELAEVNTAAIR